MTASDVPYTSLEEAARAVQSGAISSLALTERLIERIAAIDAGIHAITDVLAASARQEARRADRWRAAGRMPSAIAGVPVVVKDIIDTPPAACSAGLSFLAEYRPEKPATVVRRLRRAGAVVLGVTASDPGAFGVRTPSVRHPQGGDRTVGGSSGGSGAALAAGFAFAALGTDTGGSIRIPAACCAVAGLKPTRGRVPTTGVRPLVWSLDHVGPLTPRVADLPFIQPVLDPRYASTGAPPARGRSRIGHDPAYYRDADAAVRDGIEAVLASCHALGCEVVEVSLPDPDDVLEVHTTIFCAEAAAYHGDTFPEHIANYPDEAKVLLDLARGHTGADYVRAARRRAEITRRVETLFKSVDLLVLPTLPVLPPRRDAPTVAVAGKETNFTLALVRYTCLFDHTGHPVVAMPSKVLGPGLATSVQVVAGLRRDAAAVAFAGALERQLDLEIDRDVRV